MGDILQLILDKIREVSPLSPDCTTLIEIEALVQRELKRELVELELEEDWEADIKGNWWFRFRAALACWVAP